MTGEHTEDALHQVLAFAISLDQLKSVERGTRPRGLARKENAAEHSWHVAVLAMALRPACPFDVDIGHVAQLLLVHDIPEIVTGDQVLYRREEAERANSEEAAAAEIFGVLPEPTGRYMARLWSEFEEGETRAAQYAHAVDRLIPVLQNLYDGGRSWLEYGVTLEQVLDRNRTPIERVFPRVWAVIEAQLHRIASSGAWPTGTSSVNWTP